MAYFSSKNPNKTLSTQLTIGISLIFGVFFQSLLNFFSYEISGSSIPITLMILIYWNIALPKNIGLSWSFISGILLDLNLGYFLGTHVILFLIISYLTQRYFHRIRAMFQIQQSLLIASIVFLYLLSLYVFFQEFGFFVILTIILNSLISALVWPILFGSLRIIRRKYTYA
ncbi:rod shape-determining protein MreD [SAR86 cluster bacterium]|nr:rod shape-determining protein MreD [SAR86 cluster bacterium]